MMNSFKKWAARPEDIFRTGREDLNFRQVARSELQFNDTHPHTRPCGVSIALSGMNIIGVEPC